MKYFLQFSLIFALLVATSNLQAQDSYRYKGTIGTMKVSMNFTNQWSDYFTTYTGVYSYDKVGWTSPCEVAGWGAPKVPNS